MTIYVAVKDGMAEQAFRKKIDALRYVYDDGKYSDEELEQVGNDDAIIAETGYSINECSLN